MTIKNINIIVNPNLIHTFLHYLYDLFFLDCGPPSAPDHGTVALVGSVTTYQATATQSCDRGYSRSTGTGTITCLETGSWSTSYTCTIQGSSSFFCSCSTVLSTSSYCSDPPPPVTVMLCKCGFTVGCIFLTILLSDD